MLNIQEIDRIKKIIDESDVISFDIFDTLILRKVNKPEDIFRILEIKTGVNGFAQTRIDMQIKASQKSEREYQYPHADIDEIYKYIFENTDIKNVEEIKNLEISLEYDSIVCNKEMYDLYAHALNNNKRIIAVSDMYLSKDFLEKVLKNCGYEISCIYCSANEKKVKYDGSLFQYVLQSENVLPEKIMHIGDNYNSDYLIAKKYGITSVHYNSYQYLSNIVDNLGSSIDYGINNIISKKQKDNFWFNLGAKVGGSLYLGLLKWFTKAIENEIYNRIYFLSRDGYIMFNLMKQLGYTNVEYLYISRRSLLLAGISNLDDESLSLLPPYTFGQTVDEVLAYINCNEISTDSIKSVGFSGRYDRIKTINDFNKMKELYKNNKDIILSVCKVEREHAAVYFSKNGILEVDSIIFDCGWNGSSQYLLDRVLQLINYNKKNKFYYAGIMSSAKAEKQLVSKSYTTFLFDINYNSHIQKDFFQAIVIAELFFGAPHPSVIKYEVEKPVFDEEEQNYEYRKDIYEGIYEYIILSYQYTKKYNLDISPETASQKLIELINHPTLEEANIIGNLSNIDGFVSQKNNVKYIAKLSLGKFLRNIDTEIYWPQGLIVREDTNPVLKYIIKNKYRVSHNKVKIKKYYLKRSKVSKAVKILLNEGPLTLIYHIKNKMITKKVNAYEKWIKDNESNIEKTYDLAYNPLISIVVPVYNVVSEQLIECIESVLKQTYTNWELCLVDDASTWQSVRKVLKKYEKNNKINIKYRDINGHISVTTNDGIEMSQGEYIAFLDCDDVLSINALYEMVVKLNENRHYDFIYSDEDKLTADGKKRHSPFFKPDWSPDTFMSLMYTCHFSLYRSIIVKEINGLTEGLEGAQDYDFTLRFTENTTLIGHVPKILYHWRERVESIASNPESKPYALEAIKKLKEAALMRRGLSGKVEYVPDMYQYRVIYFNPKNPKVSIVIPSKDNFETLHRCINSITKLTTYTNYEIIVVDNGSNSENKEKYSIICRENGALYIYEKMDFNFSKMCNIGAEYSKGSLLLFLNDDTEVITQEWLSRLVGQASLKHSGAVGAKLLYPNSNIIQHIGITNLYIGPSHSQIGFDDKPIYYYGRNRMDYNFIAVTGACFMINKEKFHEVGGFDEKLTIGYNDVDLCFKLVEHGYYNITRNDVKLYHYESLSRGVDDECSEKSERLQSERERLYKKHPNFFGVDPFYNINLSKNKVNYEINVEEYKALKKVHKLDYSIDIIKYKTGVEAVIDKLIFNEYIMIEGWAFIKNRSFHNLNTIKVIFISDEDRYIIDTDKVFRPDVTNAFERKRNVNFSGFYSKIKPDEFKKNKYQIGLIVCNDLLKIYYYSLTDRYLIIQ